MSYEEYRPYIRQEDSNSITIDAEGWTKVIHDTFDEVIRDNFGMIPIGDRCWADEYKDGRRRCISISLINNSFATLKWGWNFDYIPRKSGNKLVWCKTDKSIYAQTYQFSERFIAQDKKEYQRTTFGCVKMTQKSDKMAELIRDHQVAWDTVCDEIRTYYEQTVTYEGLLENLRKQLEHKYYRFVNPGNCVVHAFVERYLGDNDKAQKDFEEISFTDDNTKDEYYKRFMQIEGRR